MEASTKCIEPAQAEPGNKVVSRHRLDNVYAVWCADGSVGLCGVVTKILPAGVELVGNGTCPNPLDVKLTGVYADAPKVAEQLSTIAQVPWDPSGFVGFSDEQIALIKRGWDHALNLVHLRAQVPA